MKKWGISHGKITLGYIMKRQSFVLCWNMAIFRNYLWLQYKSMTTYKITKAGLDRLEEFKNEWREVMNIYQFVSRGDGND